MPCIFCSIVAGEKNTEFLYQDEHMVVFKDNSPANDLHFLVVTKQHIDNINSLNADHASLLRDMIKAGKNNVEKLSTADSKIRLGFHHPMVTSVNHLHMHAMLHEVPGFVKRFMFKDNSYWFISADSVLKKLESGNST